jgi:TatD DNase family protein
VLALARARPAVRPALGFHPERLDLTDRDLEAVLAQVETHRGELIALGEVGLPWYALEGRADAGALAARGRERLARLLALAARLELPVSLHAPHGAAAEALELLDRAGGRPAVFHWHKAEPAMTRRIVEAGHFVGITPEVAYRDRDRALVRAVPLSQLVAESDGPWAYQDRRGEPAMVAEVAAAIGGLRGLTADEGAAALADNARRAFALP